MPPTSTKESEYEIISKAQELYDNNFKEAAIQFVAVNKLKYKIVDGKFVSDNDKCEPFLARFVTQDERMILVKNDVRKYSKVNDEVLIHGPTGTGKELLAHALHGDRDGNFLSINCAGMPETLLESELFGHVRGAFTGATADKVGLTVAAKGGSLFFDEVGELPLTSQAKLLRVIQSKRIRPVGSNEERDITCRFIFATNKDLEHMCAVGSFREDLYARISVFELETLSLKDRIEDAELILRSLGADDKVLEWNREHIKKNVLLDIYKHNVRSLQALVRRYNVLGRLPV